MPAARLAVSPLQQHWRGITIVAISVTAILVAALLGEPLFATNDDAGLAMLGAGFGIAAAPDPHLIFSHYGYGLYLNALSRIVGAPAHGWTTLAALGLSLGLFLRSMMPTGCGPIAVAAGTTVAIGAIFVGSILEPQFTITATLLTATAISCQLTLIRTADRSRSAQALIYVALALGYLIRPSSVLLVLAVMGPAVTWLLWRSPQTERRRIGRFVAIVIIMGAAAGISDWAGYASSPDWSNALEYNHLRALFNDFSRVPWIPDAPEYKQAGWSHNDYLIFMQWYANHPIFDLSNIRLIAYSLAFQADSFRFPDVARWIAIAINVPVLAILVLIQILLCAVLRRHRTLALLYLGGCLLCIALIALTGRPPLLRVWSSVIATAVLGTLPLLAFDRAKSGPVRMGGLGLLVAASVFVAATCLQQHVELVAKAAAYRQALASARHYLSGKIIGTGDKLIWEWLVTPTTVYPPVANITIPSIALFASTPIMQAALQRQGIGDLSLTLCTEADIRLISGDAFVAVLQKFCEEHYRTRVSFKRVFSAARTNIYVSAPQRLPDDQTRALP